jgi:signal transduction histidine kinase
MADTLTESLTNCLKHSKGSRVEVTITILHGIIKLEIKDDGPPPYGPVRAGIGLQGIEERVAGSGGTVILDHGSGFSVICLWRRHE